MCAGVDEGGDRVVTTSTLAHGAAGGWAAPESREPVWGGTEYRFAGPSALQPQAYRVNVLLKLQLVVGIEPPSTSRV